MAGDKNRNRVRAAGAADGADGLRFADLPRDFTVTACFAAGDFLQCTPDVLLERRAAGQIERRDIFRFTPGKNTFQRGGGRMMPAENCGRDASPRRPVSSTRAKCLALWEIQLGQTFSRIARDELSKRAWQWGFQQMNFYRAFSSAAS